jgi:putative membrane protein
MNLPNIDISYWIFQTIAMLLTCFFIPRLRVSGPIPAFFTVLTLAFVNSHLWNAALFFQIPDHFAVKTLMLFVANGLIFWLVVKLLPGIEVDGFLPALAAPVVFTVTSLVISQYGSKVDWAPVWNKAYKTVETAKTYFGAEEKSAQPTPKSHHHGSDE